MSDPSTPFLVHAAIARLVGDDPLAPVILAAVAIECPDSFAIHAALALVVESFDETLLQATRLSSGRRERQHLAIVSCFLQSDVARARLLAREHLAEFPDDIVISWLATKH
jgi:DNA-binding GntR family transcriptional regulator